MEKKRPASSQPERLVSKSGADILNSPLSAEERATLARIAERQAADDDSGINFEDIPELTAEQLARAVRPAAKHLVTMRLDPDVVDWLRSYGEGYSTRANAILRAVKEKQR